MTATVRPDPQQQRRDVQDDAVVETIVLYSSVARC